MVRDTLYRTVSVFEPYSPEAMIVSIAGGYGERLLGVEPGGDPGDRTTFRLKALEWLLTSLISENVGYLSAKRFADVFATGLVRTETDFDAAAALIVADSVEAIASLASALVEHRSMEGEQLQDALRSAGAFSPFETALDCLHDEYRERLWRDLIRDLMGSAA
jgi:hypothetical protein